MIQLGSKVRVVRPGRFELRGEVVDMGPVCFGGRSMVNVRPDPDQFSTVAAKGRINRWVELMECIEDPVMPDSPDAPLPRPGRDDADALRILSDWLEEQGNDPGAALLRDVAGRIECGVETREEFAEFGHTYGKRWRCLTLDEFRAMRAAGDVPG